MKAVLMGALACLLGCTHGPRRPGNAYRVAPGVYDVSVSGRRASAAELQAEAERDATKACLVDGYPRAILVTRETETVGASGAAFPVGGVVVASGRRRRELTGRFVCATEEEYAKKQAEMRARMMGD